MNNEPLKFNTKKGKPPMPVEGDMQRQSSGEYCYCLLFLGLCIICDLQIDSANKPIP